MEKFILLGDLVKSQNDQLLHIRRLLDETMFRNDLLLDELEKIRQEVPHKVLPGSEETPTEPSADLTKVEQNSDWNDVVSNGQVSSDVAQDDPKDTDTDEYDHPITSSAFDDEVENPLVPFCSKEGPWKYLQIARKVLKSFSPTKILVVKDELILDNERRIYGTLVKPQYRYIVDPKGRYEQKPYEKHRWTKTPEYTLEVIWSTGPDFFYLGTYETSFSKVLDATDFNKLSKQTKSEVYRLTSDSVKKTASELDLPSKYRTGELEALQIDCQRVGFNEEFNRCLFEASGRATRMNEALSSRPEGGSWLSKGVGNETNKTGGDSIRASPAQSAGGGASLTDANRCASDAPSLSECVPSSGDAPKGITQMIDALCVYQFNSSPSKKLKAARKEGIIRLPTSTLKITVKLDEFVIDFLDIQSAFEIVPKQQLGSKKRGFLVSPSNIEKRMAAQQEIILGREFQFYHLGTYKAVSMQTLTPQEFEHLPLQTKQRVYFKASNGGGKKLRQVEAVMNLEAKFASGELKVVKIDYVRVGLNTDVQRLLGEWAAQGF